MVTKSHKSNNLTDEGRKKGHDNLMTRLKDWPSYIKNDMQREACITEKMNGRRYDEPGMEVRFKPL